MFENIKNRDFWLMGDSLQKRKSIIKMITTTAPAPISYKAYLKNKLSGSWWNRLDRKRWSTAIFSKNWRILSVLLFCINVIMITIVSKKIVSKESYHKSELESGERKYLFLIIIRNLSNVHRGFTTL